VAENQLFGAWNIPYFVLIYAQFTHNIFCTQYWDKMIKRYCNKNIKRHFSSNIFFSCVIYARVNWKYLFLDNYAYWNLVWKYFKLSLQYSELKNIFLSKYLFISILCAKILCVTWAYAHTFIRGQQSFAHCVVISSLTNSLISSEEFLLWSSSRVLGSQSEGHWFDPHPMLDGSGVKAMPG
jgi:hypothetical protein